MQLLFSSTRNKDVTLLQLAKVGLPDHTILTVNDRVRVSFAVRFHINEVPEL